MMCSRMLKRSATGGRGAGVSGEASGFTALYRKGLEAALRRRWAVIGVMLGIGAGAVFLFRALNAELSPLEDRGNIIIMVVAPEGATLEYTDRYAREIEAMLRPVPEVRSYFMVVAPGLDRPNPVNAAIGFVRLKPWDQRQRSQQEIAATLLPKLMALPGVMAFAINPPSLGQSFRNPPVQFVVQGPSYEQLDGVMVQLVDRARRYAGMVNVDSDLKLDKPQISVRVNRERAADVGVDVDEIGRTLQTLLGGRQVTRFKKGGEQYDVIVALEDAERATVNDVGSIYLRSDRGGLVQLANLVEIQEQGAAKELNHFNRLRSAVLSASIAPGFTLGEALAYLAQAAKETLPADFKTDLDGQSREFAESSRTLYLTFAFALLFIYLVLAAQFESFSDPLIIMLTVPLAVNGALLSLKWTGGTLNVYSQIGMIMLIGLVTKNGILIVEFANQLQKEGRRTLDAVVEASVLRFRPILMTSLTMILGALPLALSSGAGAESRRQIGWVIVGGLLIGTLFTVFIIPAVYTFLSRPPKAADEGNETASGAV
jgi:multidrug efflux pump